ILNLTINNSSIGSSNETACNSFDWNGNTYTQSGQYTFQTTNAAGCDSMATLQLTINHFSSDDDLAFVITDVSFCNGNDGSIQLNITGGTAPYTIHWSNGATTTSISNLTAGGYTVTVTDANNCEAVSLVHVQPDNTIPVAGFTHTQTGGNIAFKNTTINADSIYWDFGDGSGVSNVADPTHTYAVE